MFNSLIIRRLGQCDYLTTWQAMKHFTATRDTHTTDELWLLEHPPVFTQGQAGKAEHLLNPGEISVVQTDRGGQVTYHGPGQLIGYVLFDLTRLKISTRQLVNGLENVIIQVLADYNIQAVARCEAPGVYINDAKICSIGLRVRKGYSYHGLAFNIAMNLEPFSRINPCGFSNLPITQLGAFCPNIDLAETADKTAQHLATQFGYNDLHFATTTRVNT
ncbi:MAG: lipoyl(octanoyl) transferase LipB [Gammaproteobacteria bacterium]